MREGIGIEKQKERAANICRHHWIIELPQGATSRGVCKRCGTARRFPNAAADALRERGGSSLGRWSGRRGVVRPTEISLLDSMDDAEF